MSRIAVVHSFYRSENPSGENGAVRAQVAALQRMGHEVELVALSTDDQQGKALYPLRAAARVATGRGTSPLERLDRFNPDVVYVHNLFPNFGSRWVDEWPGPIVAVLHNYRPMCVNGMLFREGKVCTLCPDGDRWAGVKHACYRESRLASLPLAWSNRHGPAEDPLLRRADRVVVLSDLQRDLYVGSGLPREKLVVVPNFLPDHLDPGSDPVQEEREGWLFVGRLSHEKGVLELVRRWPQSEILRIVGEGPVEDDVRKAAVGKPVHVTGTLSRDEVVALMRRSMGLVFASSWFEGLPLVYIEALASGTPVVGLGPSVVPRLVEADGTGVVTSMDDLDAGLASCRARSEDLSTTCRSVFEARYAESGFVRRTAELHRGLRVKDV